MQCPDCSAEAPEDDLFCESCGRRLAPPPPAPALAGCTCGAAPTELDEDGFCLRCGRKVRRPASDHIEESLGEILAAVSDRGVRHDRNEDRFAIGEAADAYAIVVCDGVSTSHKSEEASEAVCQTVRDLLVNALEFGNVSDPETLMRKAIAAGSTLLIGRNARNADENPPSTTVVAAMVREGVATIGWVGDSRAYWMDGDECRQLTQDHSWINAVVAAGEMSEEDASRSPQAHAITRWIGADANDPEPADVVRFELPAQGTLMLCTDGLWNYAPMLRELAEQFSAACQSTPDLPGAARNLVAFANSRGGQDNITVALLRLQQKS